MLEFIVTFAILFPFYALFGQFVGKVSLSDIRSANMRMTEHVDPLSFVSDKFVPNGMTKEQVYIVGFVFFWPIVLGFSISVMVFMFLKACLMSFANFASMFKILKTLFIKVLLVKKNT